MTVDLRSDSSDIKIFYWNVFYPLTDLCWESGCIVLISSNMAAILLSWSLSLVDWVSLQRHKQVIQYTGHIKWIKIISEFYDWQLISKTHSEILQIKHILLLFYTSDTETKNLQKIQCILWWLPNQKTAWKFQSQKLLDTCIFKIGTRCLKYGYYIIALHIPSLIFLCCVW